MGYMTMRARARELSVVMTRAKKLNNKYAEKEKLVKGSPKRDLIKKTKHKMKGCSGGCMILDGSSNNTCLQKLGQQSHMHQRGGPRC